MLSVPRPSEAARFAGQIFSNIYSTIFEIWYPPAGALATGAIFVELAVDLLRDEFDPGSFLDGEAPAFLT